MSEQFVSYAQNGEDVVLWRALHGVQDGCYVDVGAMDPAQDSVTKAFYDRGWRGLSIEPAPALAERLAAARPDDEVLQSAIGSRAGTVVLHDVVGTGLSTLSEDLAAGYLAEGRQVVDVEVPVQSLADAVAGSRVAGREVHFLKVDVEGAEADVLASADLRTWRPWVLVVEATPPNTADVAAPAWEPDVLAAGYRLCLFDGLNRFYVADEHADLQDRLSYPACVLDEFVRADLAAAGEDLARSWDQVVHWRNNALASWASDVTKGSRQVEDLRKELERTRNALVKARDRARDNEVRADELGRRVAELEESVSWRVTRPLRKVRSAQMRMRGGR